MRFRAREELRGRAWTAESDGAELVLAKPRNYMNRSGRAGAALCRHYGIVPHEMLVVYDDADLELGRIRLRPFGGAGGHNGIRSLMDSLGGGGFPRVRLGVCGESRGEQDLADYVLDRFAPDEEPIAEALVELGTEAVAASLLDGLEAAMNRYNGRSVSTGDGTVHDEQG
jgi:PTH1 family peptidyl-tRNA hydrolase